MRTPKMSENKEPSTRFQVLANHAYGGAENRLSSYRVQKDLFLVGQHYFLLSVTRFSYRKQYNAGIEKRIKKIEVLHTPTCSLHPCTPATGMDSQLRRDGVQPCPTQKCKVVP